MIYYIIALTIVATLFWMLLFRIFAALLKIDRYHPLTQFLFRFTDVYVKPFRFGPFRRPSKIDLAVIPPLALLSFGIIALLKVIYG
jgi:uncharacterized protein YggT (Ycf19 family)